MQAWSFRQKLRGSSVSVRPTTACERRGDWSLVAAAANGAIVLVLMLDGIQEVWTRILQGYEHTHIEPIGIHRRGW
jgi:hypothetical protein